MLSKKTLPISTAATLLTGIFLLGLLVRLGWIGAHGLWNDEVISIETSQRGLSFIFSNRFGWIGNQTTWYYALLWLVSLPVDPASSPLIVRLPSALAGALLPLVTYGLGKELFKKSTGLIAAFMVACAPVLLDYSHDVRPYSLLAFLTALSAYCVVKAEQTGKGIWWAAFAASMVANMANAYMAVVLVLPPLLLYVAWTLWRLWSKRREDNRSLRYAVVALLLVGVISILMVLEVLQMPRTPGDWSSLSLSAFVNLPMQLLTWFSGLGISGTLGSLVSLILLLAAVLGAYLGFRHKCNRGVVLCALFCLVPAFILAVLSVSAMIFPRYALFVAPFYFLLIGEALGSALHFSPAGNPAPSSMGLVRSAGIVSVGLACALFLVGVFDYTNPPTHNSVSYRPDFRGAVNYLSKVVTPEDTIIVADDPAIGYNVANFYWHYQPPAHLYDARDPLLFSQPVQGNIYWIISSLDDGLIAGIADSTNGWTDSVMLEKAVVIKETPTIRRIDAIVSDMVAKLDAVKPGYQPTLTLKGELLQAKGDLTGAAQAYRDAGTYFPLGSEYLHTAEGFSGLGLKPQAWREGVIAQAMEPFRSDIHSWLASMLQAEGYQAAAKEETDLAALLNVSHMQTSTTTDSTGQPSPK